MRIVFFGTPEFAVPALRAIVEKHSVMAVLTQPDRPSGRGHKLTPSPVKTAAMEMGIPVCQPPSLKLNNSRDIRKELKSFDADIFVVAAYGLMLPRGILYMPRYGCINIHASLLPKYRGASPIHAALLNGDSETGISIMQMDEGIDTGDVLLTRTTKIPGGERFAELHDRLAVLGAECIADVLADFGGFTAVKQDDSAASHAPMIKKTDGRIDWSDSVIHICNKNRAYDLWPGTYTVYNGKTLKIRGMEPLENKTGAETGTETGGAPSGTVIAASPADGLVVQAGDGLCRITELQGHGGKRMSAADFLRGNAIEIGALLYDSKIGD